MKEHYNGKDMGPGIVPDTEFKYSKLSIIISNK